MIRDPSDGSVRGNPENLLNSRATAAPAQYTSGLQTGSAKPENLARLEKSRQWLRDYHAGNLPPETAIADGEK